jgi:hypothetical protein
MTGPKRSPKRPLTMADITDGERMHLELCVHEAGHAVAGVTLGAQLRSAVVVNSRVWGVDGLTTFAAGLPPWRDAEVAYAGPWSQAKFRSGGRRPTQRQVYAVLSGSGHKDERAMCAAATGADVYDDPFSRARLAVPPLVEMTWPAVVSVAKLLHRNGEVHHDDVLAALGCDDGGGPTSTQLAGIRSGFRSVPSLSTKNAKQPVPAG